MPVYTEKFLRSLTFSLFVHLSVQTSVQPTNEIHSQYSLYPPVLWGCLFSAMLVYAKNLTKHIHFTVFFRFWENWAKYWRLIVHYTDFCHSLESVPPHNTNSVSRIISHYIGYLTLFIYFKKQATQTPCCNRKCVIYNVALKFCQFWGTKQSKKSLNFIKKSFPISSESVPELI